MAKRNANRTMPAEDPTGRRPPAQPKAPADRSTPPGGGRPRPVKVTGRDPRAGHHGPKVPPPNPAYGR
jgi:hypothetical protein